MTTKPSLSTKIGRLGFYLRESHTMKDNQYEYNIKDHLGNLRVAFRDNGGIAELVQANSYGIWGEDLPTLSYLKPTWKADNFKFTGKESLQETGFIDFGARWYDNIVPRFTTIDPLSELSRRFSPTVYANNNPQRFIDPDGMRSVWNGKFGSESGYNDNETGESVSWGQVQREYGLGGSDDKGKSLKEQKQERDKRVASARQKYGDTANDRISNSQFWKDMFNQEGGFEPDPTVILAQFPEIATFVGPGGAIKGIKGLQIGLRNPRVALQIMEDMLAGTFDYTAKEGIIAGFVDSKGMYYVSEGHHRMAAAFEIFKKTGNFRPCWC